MTASTLSEAGADPARHPFPEGPARPWWRIPLYPIAFPSVLVTLIWAGAGLPPIAGLRPLVVALVVGVLITFVCCAVTHDRDRGGVLATVVLIGLIATDPRLLWILAIAAILLLVESIVRRGRPWRLGPLATRLLTIVAVILVFAAGIRMVQDGTIPAAMTDLSDAFASRPRPTSVEPTHPDIFVIVLDGYPGPRGTAHVPDFDPDAFPDALAERGFLAQADSHSNYMFTPLSLTSMLWMRHLEDIPSLGPPWDSGNGDGRRQRRALNEAPALDILASKGYELVAVASGYDHVEIRRVDRVVSLPEPGEFELALVRLFPAGHLLDALFPDLLSSLVRGRILGTFEAVRTVTTEPHDGPRFVLGHIPAPHYPFVFGPNGEPRTVSLDRLFVQDPGRLGVSTDAAFRLATDQATYVASLTVDLVDDIVAADPDAVVVVMSDHGSGIGLDSSDASRSDLVERFSNVLAIRAPGHPDILAKTLTPVNVMPRVFDAYLGLTLPEATNATYSWSTSTLDPLLVTPVPEWAP